ncbi:MAG: hypothetical protein Q8Q18_01130 [bacterium]|nr:hypothetical protein [bacterium]
MNETRRKMFKLIAFGGVTFFLGRFFGRALDHLGAPTGKETYFKDFRIMESNKQLGIYGSDGDKILVIDKESF